MRPALSTLEIETDLLQEVYRVSDPAALETMTEEQAATTLARLERTFIDGNVEIEWDDSLPVPDGFLTTLTYQQTKSRATGPSPTVARLRAACRFLIAGNTIAE